MILRSKCFHPWNKTSDDIEVVNPVTNGVSSVNYLWIPYPFTTCLSRVQSKNVIDHTFCLIENDVGLPFSVWLPILQVFLWRVRCILFSNIINFKRFYFKRWSSSSLHTNETVTCKTTPYEILLIAPGRLLTHIQVLCKV